MFDSIVFSAQHWRWPAIALALLCLCLATWSYWTARGSAIARLIGASLKTIAFAALAICLLEPVQRLERPLPGANTLGILLDNSRSMELRPSGSSTSRAAQIAQLIKPEASWQMRLAQDFSIKKYLFDARVQAVDDLASADFQGQYSMLGTSIETLQTRFSSQPMAGVILLTDGLSTDSILVDDPALEKFPIYPIIAAGADSFKDISIGETSVALSSFELSPVTIDATILCHGVAGRGVTVRVFDSAGKTLEKQSIKVESDDFQKRVRLQFKSPGVGWQTVRVRAMLTGEDSDDVSTVSPTEITELNNVRLVGVDRGGGPYRILYVAGRPNWEFKFLRRALEEDPEIKLHGLIRVAKKEPRFSFGDKSLGDVNPLVAGFTDNSDTAEKIDEPVLIKIGVEESGQLQAGFPGSAEDLFQYHAIIFDDVESSFFNSEQMMLVRQFVAERGGGFMMLGGQESFLGGGYEGTPIGDLLPVYLRGVELASLKSIPSIYGLTREGALQPWLRIRPTKLDEQQRFAKMPAFQVWNTVAEVKPGASILANLKVDDRELPGLIVQKFGKGQTGALMIGDFWRWSMRRAEAEKDDLAQTWRQVARWLTSDVPRRVEFEVTPPKSPTEPHRLTVELRDEQFKPLDNGTVQISVTEPNGKEITVSLQPDAQVSGRYFVDYWSRYDGGYACKVRAAAPDGGELDIVDSGWTAQPSAAEFERVMPDMKLLEQLASRSGGEVIPMDKLDDFVDSLPSRKVPITETRIEPWWHRPWLVMLAIGCLCAEWGLRRLKGLP